MSGALLLAAALGGAVPSPSAAAGRAIFLHGDGGGAIPCAACHGLRGEGRPGTGAPPLAGLGARGVLVNLQTLASGGGSDAVMQRVASSLTPAERSAVAAYIDTLKPNGARPP